MSTETIILVAVILVNVGGLLLVLSIFFDIPTNTHFNQSSLLVHHCHTVMN
ncbi:unnamed protein product [Fructobacillus tropaeoli]|nr:unnamed protein product [Fructobacillus tropaeoli]